MSKGYQEMIAELLKNNLLNSLDAIEYSNMLSKDTMPMSVIYRVQNKIADMYKDYIK